MVDMEKANSEALNRLLSAQPTLVDMGLAKEVIPGFKERMLTHAGPPIEWTDMSGPLRGAVIAGILFEGWEKTPREAERLAASGEITYEPNHHHHSVGPMAGVITPSMPVFVVENKAFGNKSYTNMNEGLGKVMRMGAYSEEVIKRLHWMKDVMYPTMQAGIRRAVTAGEPIDLKNIIAQALHMGDELHNRNKAATSLFVRVLAPYMIEAAPVAKDVADVVRFLDRSDIYFVNLAMAAAKASLLPAHDVKGSSMVTIMSRNGTEFGIKVSGLGDEWFTAPAAIPKVLLFPGFTEDDVNPDIGDSAIMETLGVGGFALAAAPAIVQFIGGSPQDSVNYTLEMYEITVGENNVYTIPYLNFRGTPTGIDMLKVAETGITPILDTGVACKRAGVGQVGAGIVRMPIKAFEKAAERFVEMYAD
ncbi:Protein of unknown function (DUF1116) [Acetomicrobium mobile DSM 13181]|uniref:DUF1116 domain-containing protein n=1 Tax=Acetomicrobium mobile (strain ATCC BAA-54 / DSM 13181 / JCM 12221 / NGA) TaxID=891968 RepID=I4BX51_ACEMN|nr:Protein of unknown function (DUF1116) [Acetomicrobium mobile DSM 13181]